MNLDVLKEFFSRLTWVDYIALVALLRGIYVGYTAGFFHELLRMATLVVTLAVTMFFFEGLAQLLTLHTSLNLTTARITAFCALMAGVFLIAKVIQLVVAKVLQVGEGGILNRVLGMATGGVRYLVLLSFLFLGVDAGPVKQLQEDVHKRSLTGERVAQVAPVLLEFFSSVSPEILLSKNKEN